MIRSQSRRADGAALAPARRCCRPSGLRSAPGPRTGRWAAGSRRRTPPGIGHLLADGLDRLPPGHRLVSRVGQHCLRLVEGRHFRRVASVEPLSDQPCHFLGLHRLRSTGHLTTFSGEGRAAIHLPCRPGPAVPGPGLPAATPHDNWCMDCTGRSTHLPLPEAGTDSPSCAHRRRFETGCRSAPVTVRDPTFGPASSLPNRYARR
jgi:hypothetical protein